MNKRKIFKLDFATSTPEPTTTPEPEIDPCQVIKDKIVEEQKLKITWISYRDVAKGLYEDQKEKRLKLEKRLQASCCSYGIVQFVFNNCDEIATALAQEKGNADYWCNRGGIFSLMACIDATAISFLLESQLGACLDCVLSKKDVIDEMMKKELFYLNRYYGFDYKVKNSDNAIEKLKYQLKECLKQKNNIKKVNKSQCVDIKNKIKNIKKIIINKTILFNDIKNNIKLIKINNNLIKNYIYPSLNKVIDFLESTYSTVPRKNKLEIILLFDQYKKELENLNSLVKNNKKEIKNLMSRSKEIKIKIKKDKERLLNYIQKINNC